MSRNLGFHINHATIIKSPDKFDTIIRDYLKQKLLKNVKIDLKQVTPLKTEL